MHNNNSKKTNKLKYLNNLKTPIMKTLKTLLLVIAIAFSSVYCFAANNDIQLPTEAEQFIKSYFHHERITNVQKQNADYIVTLNDGSIVGFNEYGQWNQVHNPNTAFPSTVLKGLLPKRALNVITKSNMQKQVTKISFNFDEGYQVIGGSNTLKFSKSGILK